MSRRAVKFVVSGRVQGVWFRVSTQMAAQRLGVNGYVRNLPTGQVECFAVGDEEAVQGLILWAHNGPPFARVKSVEVTELSDYELPERFEIRA